MGLVVLLFRTRHSTALRFRITGTELLAEADMKWQRCCENQEVVPDPTNDEPRAGGGIVKAYRCANCGGKHTEEIDGNGGTTHIRSEFDPRR
jgi:hypothetical protein